MNYELAKKLKDAGYPQTRCDYSKIHSPPMQHRDGSSGCACSPTLSELIESCGEGIFELLRQSEWHRMETGFVWTVTIAKLEKMTGGLTLENINKAMIKSGGETPEEAVAKLWLEIRGEKNKIN